MPRTKWIGIKAKQIHMLCVGMIVALGLMGMGASHQTVQASELDDAREIVDEALYSVQKILEKEFSGLHARRYLKHAKAVFIAPELLKAAVFVGGEGGTGVLLARADNGQWSYPAFFQMGAASFGLQFGAQKTEMLLTIQQGSSLTAILEDNVTLGADLSAAIGPYGEGVSGNSGTDLEADVYTFSVNKGGFVGFSVEGASMWEDKEKNAAYYGGGAKGKDIVLHGKFRNPHADKLRDYLAVLSKK